MAASASTSQDLNEVRERVIAASHSQAALLETASSSVSMLESIMDTQSEDMAATLDRMMRVVDEVSAGREQVEALANSVREVAALNVQLTQAIRAVAAVEENVQAIREVTVDIRMLGLNAAIEAAHAGEAGKGFSIVASAIQELARKGARVADDITNAVSDSLSHVEQVAQNAHGRIAQQGDVAAAVGATFDVVDQQTHAMIESTQRLVQTFTEHKATAADAQSDLQAKMEASSGETAQIIGLLSETKVVDLSPAEAFERRTDLYLVDVRAEHEWCDELGHIEGAHHIAIASDDFDDRIAALDPSTPTLFICRSGGRSARGASLALQLGFASVFNMQGGMLKWSEHKLPVAVGSRGKAAA